MSRLVLFSESDVSFNIDPHTQSIGTFMLTRRSADLFFEWIPKNPEALSFQSGSNNKFHVGFRVSDVVSIEKAAKTLNKISLIFLFEDSSKLPAFRFLSSHSTASVRHLFEFLLSKGIIEKAEKHNYYVSWRTIAKNSRFPRGLLNYKHINLIAEHVRLVSKFNKNVTTEKLAAVTLDEAKGLLPDLKSLMAAIQVRGVDDSARWFVWPFLLQAFSPVKTYEDNAEELLKKGDEYKTIIKTYQEQMTDLQKNDVDAVSRLAADVKKDVLRTDRKLSLFSDENSPNLKMLNNIMIAYAIYSRDTGFVQGMGDIISTFIVLYVKEWHEVSEGKFNFKLSDGRELSQEDTESFIFQIFCAMMRRTQQDRMFMDLVKQQNFQFERIFAIIQKYDKPLSEWLQENNIENMIFMYRQLILLFKREFESDKLKRIWDSFFSNEQPWAQVRFFSAALMIKSFPRLLLNTNGSIEEVMNECDKAICESDIEECIKIANIMAKSKKIGCAFDSLPLKDNYLSYKSKYLKL